MATRIGIAADLEERKWELEKEFRETRNWKMTKAFASKKLAKDWLKNKALETKLKTVADGKPPPRPNDKWYGFSFDHSGPF